MADCSFRIGVSPDWRCLYPVQEDKSLCIWHDPDVKKTKAEVEAAVSRGAHLTGADLTRTDLTRADLAGAHLTMADLTRAVLAGANLTGAALTGAALTGAVLTMADFSEADLTGAKLGAANLMGANLTMAVLAGANLMQADLTWAVLTGANLTGANLTMADLTRAVLTGAVLTEAALGWTTVADCDLRDTKGLESVFHMGPSSIGVDTIFKSKGRIPPAFLRGAGVPESFIKEIPRMVSEVRYYNSFICYGEPDRAFAEKLESDLRSQGLFTWAYFMDATPGERTWGEIGKNRREAEKMIVLCSAQSLIRDGVLKEVEEQIDEDPDKMVPVSLDNLWKEPGFRVMRASRDLKPFLLNKNYADFSDPKTYETALERLLRALQTSREVVLAEGEP